MGGTGSRTGQRQRARVRCVAGTGAATLATALLMTVPSGPAIAEGLHRMVVDPVGAQELHARERWQQVADTLEGTLTTSDTLYVAADAASTLAARVAVDGWRASDVPGLVAALLSTANPDGGYGLAKPWDAYQDGTVNPASTSYTATTAGHVGPVLLAGYAAGVVPASAVQRTIDFLLRLPRSFSGRCIPYSSSPHDLDKPCVWNVHYGAADWVLHASELLDYRTADAREFARTALSWLDDAPPDATTGYWPYSSAGGAPQDLGHQLWTAAAVDSLRGTHQAMTLMLSRSLWRTQARVAHNTGVASAMGSIALFDCRLARDATVLRYALPTAPGASYTVKALAAQASAVLRTCFPTPRSSAAGRRATRPLLRDLG
ncbi:MAG TPA: hypothetical protein VI248_14350 [Kineosporiaceae bacterium]